MKLLLDANISWRSAQPFAACFGECIHVNKTELPVPATDTQIWNFAAKNGYCIVTQDADFLNFLETKGYPPKVILLRKGNLSRKEAEEIVLNEQSAIMAFDRTNYGLLEIL
jgi:predicted nuclease of predicted toxin-antitoxin system